MTKRDNRGAVWGNKKKEKPSHPDFKGEATIDGVELWVSAWRRDPDNNNPKAPALTFAFTPKDEAHKQGMQQAKQAFEEDSDLPF